jgi:hypothetical protein
MTFNAAYFACDKICDALYAKDVNGAMLLIKLYGAMPAVMSLVEKSINQLSLAPLHPHRRRRTCSKK